MIFIDLHLHLHLHQCCTTVSLETYPLHVVAYCTWLHHNMLDQTIWRSFIDHPKTLQIKKDEERMSEVKYDIENFLSIW